MGSSRDGGKGKRIKMCYEYVPTLHNKYNLHVLQACSNEKNF